MLHLELTRCALLDIADIEAFTIEKWGEKVAKDYLDSIEQGLNRLRENPGLLRSDLPVSDSLCFYRVRQHYLVCALFDEAIYVLTIKHTAMDLPQRLAELEPQLSTEADMLYQAFKDRPK